MSSWTRNPELPYNHITWIDDPFENYQVPEWEQTYELIWYVDPAILDLPDRVWAVKWTPPSDVLAGTKDMGNLFEADTRFDVVFLSYNEANYHANLQKVKELVPSVKSLNGVKGIFQAHKAASHVANTDMFWVVDGDAEILPDFDFNYRPAVFDRDCIHIWHSRNPVNNLEYGYGGVKLFPRKLLVDAVYGDQVDVATSLTTKIKVVPEVSNITAFNTDPFNTWKSAFRECSKLAAETISNDAETSERLKVWAEQSKDPYATRGAREGAWWGKLNKSNVEQLRLINNTEWLRNRFDQQDVIDLIREKIPK